MQVVQNFALAHQQHEFQPEEQSGQAIRVEGNVHKVQSMQELIHALYTTENNVHVFYKPTQHTPEELSLKISGFTFKQSDGEHKRPEFDDFYKQGESFFELKQWHKKKVVLDISYTRIFFLTFFLTNIDLE